MKNKAPQKNNLPALARIGMMPEFNAIKELAAKRELSLGSLLLLDREPDPVKRKENADVSYGEMVGLRSLISKIESAVKQTDAEEDKENV